MLKLLKVLEFIELNGGLDLACRLRVFWQKVVL